MLELFRFLLTMGDSIDNCSDLYSLICLELKRSQCDVFTAQEILSACTYILRDKCSFYFLSRAAYCNAAFFYEITDSYIILYSSIVCFLSSSYDLSRRINSQGSSFSAQCFRFIQNIIANSLQFKMGNQICRNYDIQQSTHNNKANIHSPDASIFPQVGDDVSALPCQINHIRQQFMKAELTPPQNYEPSPFSKDSFYQLAKDHAYYKGEWKNGWPHGQGEVIFKDKSYFKGYFRQMKAKGPDCLFVLRDGSYYRGGVSQNKREGKGKYVIEQNYTYQGEWLNNLPHGLAREHFQNGDAFEGRFIQGKRNGEGTYIWANGIYKKYEGMFEQNMIGQKGTLTMRDGSIIQGIFDCSEKFDISQCIIKTQQYLLKNCAIDDGALRYFEHSNIKYAIDSSAQQKPVYKFKKLIFCEHSITNAERQRICKKIEEGYVNVRLHSEAINKIREGLKEYTCNWWDEEQQKKGLIAQICGKKIIITKKI